MSKFSPARRTVLGFALGWAGLSVWCGGPAVASEATEPVEQLHAGLVAIMKAGRATSFRQRYEMIAPIVSRTFDLDVILRQVIGPRWALMPADQQSALAEAFRRYTVASYVANFNAYSGERFEVAPAVRTVGPDRIVSTRILTAAGKAARPRLRDAPGGRRMENCRHSCRRLDQPSCRPALGNALGSHRCWRLRPPCQPAAENRRIVRRHFAVAPPQRSDYHLLAADLRETGPRRPD